MVGNSATGCSCCHCQNLTESLSDGGLQISFTALFVLYSLPPMSSTAECVRVALCGATVYGSMSTLFSAH